MEAEEANSQPTITGVMQYIEDQHGYTVNRVSVNMMQSLTQNIWFKLGISSVISTMWKQVDVQSKKGYYCAMAVSFFQF